MQRDNGDAVVGVRRAVIWRRRTGDGITERETVVDAPSRNGHDEWEQRTRVVLTPIAAPSILGLFGFMAATLVVAGNLAGWYGNSASPQFLFPFAAVAGGLAQFIAGMWAYKARDGLATAMHGIWGSFWIAYGILWAFSAAGALTLPGVHFPELGFWFIALAAITWSGAATAYFENRALFAVLTLLASGATVAGIGFMNGTLGVERAAGWLFAFAAFTAWYVATAMMLRGTLRRDVLPIGRHHSAPVEMAHAPIDPIEYSSGMPGVRAGQ
jgi:succinate-acetate transporter protein